MRHRRARAAALLFLVSSSARADRAEDALTGAARTHDRAALARAAERLGPARLAKLIERGSTAALEAAPELDEAWTLLGAIGPRVDTPEGARAAARIAHALRDPEVRDRLEVDVDVLDATRERCAAPAPAGLSATARADRLACAVDLGLPVDAGAVFDAAPELRAAAISLLAASSDKTWRSRLLENVRGETPSPAALAALCADDRRRTVDDLGAAAKATIKKLAAMGDEVAAPHLARCLKK